LAASNVLGPVAGVRLFVVEQAADAELFCGGAVPAGPVARARRLVAEDAVQPVTVLRALWRVSQVFVVTNVFVSPGIVATVGDALVFPDPNQPVRTIIELGLAKLALPVPVAVLHVADKLRLHLTRVVLENLVFLCPGRQN